MPRSLTAAVRTALTVALFALAYLPALGAHAAAADAAGPKCSACHGKLTSEKKVVHAAMDMVCESCHGGIAGVPKVPHQNTTKIARGLNADQPDLSFGCHETTLNVDRGRQGDRTVGNRPKNPQVRREQRAAITLPPALARFRQLLSAGVGPDR